MKKLLCIGLIIVLFLGVLCSCADELLCGGPGPTYPSFYFGSVEEFLMFFEENVQTGAIPAVEENKINYRPEREEISATYTAFVNQMVAAPVIYMPTYNQEMIPFENKEGFYNIDLYPRWTYELPWIRYSLLNENGPLAIEILYLNASVTEKVNQEVAENKELQKKEIALSDRTVSAFIEEKDNGDIKIYFFYDEIYVAVWAQPEVITDQWLKGLCFSKYTGEQWFTEKPMLPTADGIVCNNEVFLGLESSTVEKIIHWDAQKTDEEAASIYQKDSVYEFVKYLKEEPLYEVSEEEDSGYKTTTFALALKNGKKEVISVSRKYLYYNDSVYTGFSDGLPENLTALFDAQ